MTYFIVNPAAGNGKSKRAVPIINRLAKEYGVSYTIVYTKRPDDARDLAYNAAKGGAEAIVSVGGDGTVQEIVTGILQSKKKTPLGIIPAGSGNDLYCSINKNSKLRGKFDRLIETSLTVILAGLKNKRHSPFDAIKMDSEYFLNIGSVGLDAQIVKDAAGMKKIFGRFAYIASTVKNSLTYNPDYISITTDGNVINEKTTLAAVCNGAFYGGGFKIAPGAKMNDGLITVCHIKYLPKIKIFFLFPAVIMGKHVNFKEVSYTECKNVVIERNGGMLVNIDGNLLEHNGRLDLSIIPAAVRIFV